MVQTRTFAIVCLGLIVCNLLTAGVAAYYSLEVQKLNDLIVNNDSKDVSVNLCIDYQEYNGTIVWFNNTVLPFGSNLKNLTDAVAVVNATYWPSQNSFFIDAINGVWNEDADYWMWYYWDDLEHVWVYGDIGADRYVLSNSEILRWRYEFPNYTG